MKTTSFLSVALALAGSSALALATGLPIVFSLLAVAAAVTVGFGASVMLSGIVREARRPVSLASRGIFLPAQPIRRRTVRLAA